MCSYPSVGSGYHYNFHFLNAFSTTKLYTENKKREVYSQEDCDTYINEDLFWNEADK